MAHRSFTVTMAADSNYHNLYTILLSQTGAVPTDGILPDRVSRLFIQMASANAASLINVSDSNFANSAGPGYAGGDAFLVESDRNTVCLRDYYLKGNGLTFTADLEFK